MNYAAVAAVVATATLLLTVAGIVWIGGKLAQRVDDHGALLIEHGRHIEAHGKDIVALKAWRDGYNAAVSKAKDTE